MGEIQEKKFTDQQLDFIDYLSLPSDMQGTQKELAERIGVSEKTLCQWKKREDIWTAVYSRARKIFADYIPDIYKAIAERAVKGSLDHAHEVFELAGIKKMESSNGKGAVNIVFSGDIPRPKNGYDVVNIKGGD